MNFKFFKNINLRFKNQKIIQNFKKIISWVFFEAFLFNFEFSILKFENSKLIKKTLKKFPNWAPLTAHFRQINNNSKIFGLHSSHHPHHPFPCYSQNPHCVWERSLRHAHISIHAKLHQRTQASDFVCTFQITSHTHSPRRG